MLSEALTRRILAATAPDATGGLFGRPEAGQAAPTRRWALPYKAQAAWSSGNSVAVKPCNDAGTEIANAPSLTAYIFSPTGYAPAGDGIEPVIASEAVLYGLPISATEVVLVNVPHTCEGVGGGGSGTGPVAVYDEWIDVDANTDGIPISTADWRGRYIHGAIKIVSGNEAAGNTSRKWNTYEEEISWTSGTDLALTEGVVLLNWTAGDGTNILVIVDCITNGFMHLRVFDRAASYQVRITLYGSARKSAADWAVSD